MGYHKNLYANILHNLKEMDKVFEKYKLPELYLRKGIT